MIYSFFGYCSSCVYVCSEHGHACTCCSTYVDIRGQLPGLVLPCTMDSETPGQAVRVPQQGLFTQSAILLFLTCFDHVCMCSCMCSCACEAKGPQYTLLPSFLHLSLPPFFTFETESLTSLDLAIGLVSQPASPRVHHPCWPALERQAHSVFCLFCFFAVVVFNVSLGSQNQGFFLFSFLMELSPYHNNFI